MAEGQHKPNLFVALGFISNTKRKDSASQAHQETQGELLVLGSLQMAQRIVLGLLGALCQHW